MRICFLRAYADSGGPDQTVHVHSLIKTFPVCKQNHWRLKNASLESKCTDETAHVQDMNLHILCMFGRHFFQLMWPIHEQKRARSASVALIILQYS